MDTEPEAPPPENPPAPAAEGAAHAAPANRAPDLALTEDVPPVAERAPATPTATEELASPLDQQAPSPEQQVPLPHEQAPSPEPAPVQPEPPARRRRWLRAAGVLLGLLLAAAVAVVLLGPGYARGRIEEEALARGVVLAFGDLDLGLTKLRLHDVQVGLAGVRDFEASAGWIEVEIADGQPISIVAGQLSISMTGTDVLGALGKWKAEHAAALAAPFSGEGAHLEWHPSAGTAPALSLDAAKVAVDAQKGSIAAAASRLAGRDAGPLSLSWTSPPDGFVVDIKPSAPPLSAARVEVRSSKDGARVKLTLDRTPLGPLQDALGIPKGSEGIQADGEIEMPLPSVARPAPVDGSLRLTVKGYTPPHPRELDGILFGDTTTVKSKFQLAADLDSAKLTDLSAAAGALVLTGSGEVTREGLDARVSLKLKGSIPCTSLAASAAVARLGSGLGGIAGGLAAGALQGSVSVAIGVDAKASDVKGAKVTQSARIGCKVVIPGLPVIVIR